MSGEVRKAIEESSRLFRDVVWPVIGPDLGGGNLIPVETVTGSDAFARSLDTKGGIDAWQETETWMRSLACRVQFAERSYRTFTIRLKLANSAAWTEWDKRFHFHQNDDILGPGLTIQAYVHNGRLVDVAAIETRELISAALGRREHNGDWPDRGPVYVKTNRGDENQFVVVRWGALEGERSFKSWTHGNGLT